jgi:copper resistance protein B
MSMTRLILPLMLVCFVLVAEVHAQEAPACTQAHADMGHCTMPKPAAPACAPEHAAMGHCKMPEPAAPACTPEHAAMGHCRITEESPQMGTSSEKR